jgi:zinc transport system ATP-binding protein
MEYLKNNFDLSIILISHDLDYVVQYADKVILLDKTILKEGSAKEVFASEEFHSVFGVEELPGYVSNQKQKKSPSPAFKGEGM